MGWIRRILHLTVGVLPCYRLLTAPALSSGRPGWTVAVVWLWVVAGGAGMGLSWCVGVLGSF